MNKKLAPFSIALFCSLAASSTAIAQDVDLPRPGEFLDRVRSTGWGLEQQHGLPVGKIVDQGVSALEAGSKVLAPTVDEVPAAAGRIIERFRSGDLPTGQRPAEAN